MCCDYDVVVIGGSIVGLSTAVALRNGGVSRVHVYEKSETLRPIGAAIGLFPNGFRALQAISPTVHERVLASSIRTHRYVLRDIDDNVVRNSEGGGSTTLLVWYLLQQYLVDALRDPGMLSLGATVVDFSQNESYVTVHVRQHNQTKIVRARALVAADGIWSNTRRSLFPSHPAPHYHGKLMFRSVLPCTSLDACPPAGTQFSYAGDEAGKLFSLRETAVGLVSVTAMARCTEATTYTSAEQRHERLRKVFASFPPAVHEIIDRMDADAIFEHAVYDVDVLLRWSVGRVILIGDAAHAMTPGLGQGANQGLEDGCELAYHLTPSLENDFGDNVARALDSFWKSRITRVLQIHQRSRQKTANVNTSTLSSRSTSVGSEKKSTGSDLFRASVYCWKPSVQLDRERERSA